MAKKDDTLKKSTDINPSHYGITCNDVGGRPVTIEVVALIEALCPQDAHMAHIFTYLLRAGRKQKSSYFEDLNKAAWWIRRAVKFHGGTYDIDS